MKILLTGATGFVGRHLVPHLCDHKLTLIVRDISKAKQVLGTSYDYIPSDKLETIKGQHFDIIIHLAAYLTSKDDDEAIEKIVDSNIIFGLKLLNAIKFSKTKLFINFGSFAQFREGTRAVHDAYLYSASKTAFEAFLNFYNEAYKIPYISIIPYTIYGGEDSQKKIIDYIKDSVNSRDSVKMSGGRQVLDFIHVEDVAEFIIYVINNLRYFSDLKDKQIFLGTGRGISLREVAQLVENKYNATCNISWGALPYRLNDVMYAVAPQWPLIRAGWQAKRKIEDYI